MAHHRLFVALRPPATVRTALLGLMSGVPGARWQSDAQLHCTLRFIGEVDHHRAEDIAAALGHVRSPSLTLGFGDIGVFERAGRVDALWVGVQPRERVKPLHDRIDQALRSVGVPPDPRAFLPHVTIARFTRGTAPPADVASRIVPPPAEPFRSTSFELFESHLGSEGASYETIARYPLEAVES